MISSWDRNSERHSSKCSKRFASSAARCCSTRCVGPRPQILPFIKAHENACVGRRRWNPLKVSSSTASPQFKQKWAPLIHFLARHPLSKARKHNRQRHPPRRNVRSAAIHRNPSTCWQLAAAVSTNTAATMTAATSESDRRLRVPVHPFPPMPLLRPPRQLRPLLQRRSRGLMHSRQMPMQLQRHRCLRVGVLAPLLHQLGMCKCTDDYTSTA